MKLTTYQREEDIEIPDGTSLVVNWATGVGTFDNHPITSKITSPILCCRQNIGDEEFNRYFVIKDDKGPATLSNLFIAQTEDVLDLRGECQDLKRKISLLRNTSLFKRIFRWKKEKL
jgi:hypothetical protein